MSRHVVVMKLPITSCPQLQPPESSEQFPRRNECSSLTQNLIQIHWLYSLILNVMATQYMCSLNSIYQPPLTSTGKSSLFTHVHSSPLSLATRLHPCHTNHSRYINNGWAFSGQTSFVYNILRGLQKYKIMFREKLHTIIIDLEEHLLQYCREN